MTALSVLEGDLTQQLFCIIHYSFIIISFLKYCMRKFLSGWAFLKWGTATGLMLHQMFLPIQQEWQYLCTDLFLVIMPQNVLGRAILTCARTSRLVCLHCVQCEFGADWGSVWDKGNFSPLSGETTVVPLNTSLSNPPCPPHGSLTPLSMFYSTFASPLGQHRRLALTQGTIRVMP